MQSLGSEAPVAPPEQDQESCDGAPTSPQPSVHGSDVPQPSSGTSSRDSSEEASSEDETFPTNSNILGLKGYSSSEERE